MRRLLLVVFCLVWSVPAYAQTIGSYDLIIYVSGTPASQTRNVLASGVFCNQPDPPTDATNLNPNTWFWQDPVNAGKWCKVDDTVRLASLPDGNYFGTITAISTTGARGPESASAPFIWTRPAPTPPPPPPPVLTGLKVIR